MKQRPPERWKFSYWLSSEVQTGGVRHEDSSLYSDSLTKIQTSPDYPRTPVSPSLGLAGRGKSSTRCTSSPDAGKHQAKANAIQYEESDAESLRKIENPTPVVSTCDWQLGGGAAWRRRPRTLYR